MDTSGTL
jgi:hypothetical protein